MIHHEKSRFIKAEMKQSRYAHQFAKSLNINPGPLAACSEALAKQLLQPDNLDPLCLLSTLQETRNAYVE